MADFPDIVDRNVQHPNRFLSSPIAPGVIELTPDPGAGETGTELNAELFDKIKEYVDDTSNVMGYLPGSLPGKPINGFDANTVDRERASLIPMYNGVNTPVISIGVLQTIPYYKDWVMQYFHKITADDPILYMRVFHSGTAWSGWTVVGAGDTGWVPLEPRNSNYYQSNAHVRRVNGMVFFRGFFEKVDGSGVVNGNLVTTIPTGFRPANSLTTILAGVAGAGDQSAYKVSVAWTGDVTVNANLSTNTANKYLWMSSLTYPLG